MSKDLNGFEPKKILALQLRQIGDVLLATPSIRMLKARYPEAEIHVVTEAKCEPVLRHNPDITKVWTIDKSRGFFGNLVFYRKVARQGFDLVVDFQQLPRCRWIVMFSRAKVKISFCPKRLRKLLYTHWSDMLKGGYAARIKAGVLSPLGLEWDMEPPRLFPTDEERQWAREYLTSQGLDSGHTLISVDATHHCETRKWPAERYGELIRLAAEKRSDLRFLLLYGPGEREQVMEVIKTSGRDDVCILPPEEPPTLRKTAALIDQAALHLGNCSGPRHFAVALDVPSLVVVGSNGETAWRYPSDDHGFVMNVIECSKCNRSVCPKGTLECLTGISAQQVLDKMEHMLSRTPAS